ncbi:chymotrypsin-like [Anopheles albimanus]|uniref:Peptidase S1 domain-containing protein n=1 Tax=Anopheles albimanus TaxID=7167 RepID=A0A8W7K5E6_ANOAL|nr:chymotrypsin-like [Anopheles albimanus]
MKSVVVLVLLAGFASAKWIGELQTSNYYSDGPSRRIANGQEATPGQFPYQVLMLTEFPNNVNRLVTGASVLTENYVLSSASTFFNGAAQATGGTAVMGANIQDNQEPSQQRINFDASGIVIHPQYVATNSRNNVGVARLNSPMTFNDRVQPIRLPARSDTRQFEGFIGTIAGFGVFGDGPDASNVLKYTSNPIMMNAFCMARLDYVTVHPNNVCMSSEGGRSPCPGDEGSPLVVNDGGPLQIAISSVHGNPCSIGLPSVYTRVIPYLAWIETNTDYVARP